MLFEFWFVLELNLFDRFNMVLRGRGEEFKKCLKCVFCFFVLIEIFWNYRMNLFFNILGMYILVYYVRLWIMIDLVKNG